MAASSLLPVQMMHSVAGEAVRRASRCTDETAQQWLVPVSSPSSIFLPFLFSVSGHIDWMAAGKHSAPPRFQVRVRERLIGPFPTKAGHGA